MQIPLGPTCAAWGVAAACATLVFAEPAPPPAHDEAASTLSIQALVTEVLQKNPELEFYHAEIAAARAGRKAAGKWKDPEITAELGSKRAWERHGGGVLGDGPAWSVSVSQTIEFPGRIALRKAIANQQIELAELGLAQFRAALAARVRTLAHTALAAQQKADAAREVTARYQAVTEALIQRDPAGPAALLEVRVLEAATLTLNRRVSQAEREGQAALLEINQLRGVPAATRFRIQGLIPAPTPLPPLAQLLETAYTNNFELRMRQAELEQQGFKVALARKDRYPELTLAPFYSSEKAADEERIAGLGLSLPLPIWGTAKATAEVEQARLLQAGASLRAATRQLEREITDRYLGCEAKLEEIKQWRPDALRHFREAAETADRHYRLGAVPLSTYLEMQSGYLDALETLLTSQSEAAGHRLELERLVGRTVETEAPQRH
ncbi:MAG TPA: TolC family protein [Candidatus Paceibacterota bacterium]|nr:TolC family protein [Candidatus Paceibacterota bacterium]